MIQAERKEIENSATTLEGVAQRKKKIPEGEVTLTLHFSGQFKQFPLTHPWKIQTCGFNTIWNPIGLCSTNWAMKPLIWEQVNL